MTAKTVVGALALAALPSALAFRNTSPFFLLSTANLHMPTAHGSLVSSASVTAHVLDALKDCPTTSYLIFEQQGVSYNDFADPHRAPQLSRLASGAHPAVKTVSITPDVLGQVDVAAIRQHLDTQCAPKHTHEGAHASIQSYVSRDLVTITSQAHRQERTSHDDTVLGDYVFDTAKEQDFTIIYITIPQTESQAAESLEHYDYESAFPDSVQMELKRDLSAHPRSANATEGGLFERYQYFTPGLFMAFAAIIPLFLILVVGIRALTSLEVSYFAFSKEMGPNAQKRQ